MFALPIDQSATLVYHFEAAVKKYPENIALTFEKNVFTYAELNARSNVLAHYLRYTCKVQPEEIVAFSIASKDRAVIALLGILKAGAAYLPIDPAYPGERKKYMLEDAGTSFLLTETGHGLPGFDGESIFVDKEEYISDNTDNLPLVNKDDHACYIIYTSGSTGKPKGVVGLHQGVTNTVTEYLKTFRLTASENCLQFASFSFDASVLEIFMAFFSGASLFPVSKDIITDPDSFHSFLRKKKIDVVTLPPSFLRTLDKTALSEVRLLVTAGEEAVPRVELNFRDDQEYYNAYGPTECSICATLYKETQNSTRNVPIGKPIDNIRVYILDENLQPVNGAAGGEIFLAGIGLARGYLNNPALTAARFISSPFDPGKVMYRTGDQGRWMEDGNIEYLGRLDDQVKIRGHRIELREIENTLQQCAAVREAAVVVKGTDKKLTAYYVPDPQQLAIKEVQLSLQQVESWKQIYKDTYHHSESTENNFDITGWNDSFTGKAIPAGQMRLWLEDITRLILSVKPEKVLEIGCGTGLIYYQLASHIRQYTGMDFSTAAIGRMQTIIARGEQPYPPTTLTVCAAHEAWLDPDTEVDTIILNSIVQYFPGEAYLKTVLTRCIDLLKGKKGNIVIGDIRDSRLQPAFKGRLQLEKEKNATTIADFNWLVEQDILREKELCIDPDWFYRWRVTCPFITGISITWKQTDFVNELSLYRYTVVLQINGDGPGLSLPWVEWDQIAEKDTLLEQLKRGEELIALRDTPNPRLWKEQLLTEALTCQKVKNAKELAAYIAHPDKESVIIGEIWKTALAAGYHCRMFLADDPLKTHLLLQKTSSSPHTGLTAANAAPEDIPVVPEDIPAIPSSGLAFSQAVRRYTNMPLFFDCCSALQKDIRQHLGLSLPEYMLPNDWIALQKLPVTVSGKIDRTLLARLPDYRQRSQIHYQAPVTPTQKMLALIWEELLEVEKVGIHDNFFGLGGHSLKAGQLINRIYRQTGFRLVFSKLFQTALLKDIADLVDRGELSTLPVFEKIPEGDYYPLSPSQTGIWLASQQKSQETIYNIPVALVIQQPVQLPALKTAFDNLLVRHEILRTSFPQKEGLPYQQIKPNLTAAIDVVEKDAEKTEEERITSVLQTHLHTPFNLSGGPLFRISLVPLHDGRALLVFTLHHLITDGFSLQLLLDQWQSAYQALIQNATINSIQEFQYKDYTSWLTKMIESQEGERQKSYWLDKLRSIPPFSLAGYTGHSQGAEKKGALYSFRCDPAVNQGIQQLMDTTGATVFMVLEALLKLLLYKVTGQRDIIIGTAVSGREKEETEKIAGLFVNTVALYDPVPGNESFTTFLRQVKTTTMAALDHQLFPLHRVIEALQPETNAFFDCMISVDDQQVQGDKDIFNTDDPLLDLLTTIYSAAKFNIAFNFNTKKEAIEVQVLYDTNVFDKEYIALLGCYFNHLTNQVLEYPAGIIDHYSLCAGNEQELYNYLGIDAGEFESAYGLTTTQRDIYLTCLLDPEDNGLRLLVYFELTGDIDPKGWKRAIDKVTSQEDSLRSVLISKNTGIFQGVKRQAEPNFRYIDISNEIDLNGDAHAAIERHGGIPQDLSYPSFIHFLFKAGQHRYIAAASVHHIFMDGVSFKVLAEKIAGAYHGLDNDAKGYTYRQYVFQHLSKFDKEPVAQFWQQKLAAVQPLSYAGALAGKDEVLSDALTISGEEALQIFGYCKEHRLKPAAFFKAVYALLIKYYCGAEFDFCIRENLAGRSKGQSNAIGCLSFVFPALIARDTLRDAGSFAAWCASLQQEKKDTGAFRYISLSLQNRIIGEEPLSFFYNYEFFSLPSTGSATGPLVQVYNLVRRQIELRILEKQDSFELKLGYNQRIFNGTNFLSRIRHLVKQLTYGKQQLHDLRYLLDEEVRQLARFGHRETPRAEMNILRLFEQQVTANGKNLAVVSGDKAITYTELDSLSDLVAAHLQAWLPNNEPGKSVVAIMVRRSEWMVITLLGVLKAGAAYLPIDPDYPPERINYLLSDSKAALLLTHAEWQERVGSVITSLSVENMTANPRRPMIKKDIHPAAPAYVIYTSGTTGKPKGVMIEHHSLSNIAMAWRKAYQLDSMTPSLLQLASFSFDVFTGDVVRALTNGGKIIICPATLRLDLPALYELIRHHKVNMLESTPALIIPLMDFVYENKKDIGFLKLLILGSDSCPAIHYNRLVERYGHTMRVINSYGVTEACIDAGFYEGTAACLPLSGNTPIGRPLDNYLYHVCNAAHQLVPIGIPGELLIGGEGLARGYIGNETLTAEKFINLPPADGLASSGGQRFYATGDIVRWLPDGQLEFAGRKDLQVKIRGYRIELQEVEGVLLAHPDVKEGLVTVFETDNGKDLAGWYVSKTGAAIAGWTDYMQRHLPAYMVPAVFILLDAIPLTHNGKVDRKALPDPLAVIDSQTINDELPATDTEAALLTIWQDVLKRNRIGVTDNFFQIGGHSLKATHAIARIFSSFQVNLPLHIFFNQPTIKEQANYVDRQQKKPEEKITPAPASSFYPLSSSQQRFYLFQQTESNKNTYNLPSAFLVKGRLDRLRLEKSFSTLIHRYEIFRTSFEMRDGKPVQCIHPSVPFHLRETFIQTNGPAVHPNDPAVHPNGLAVRSDVSSPLPNDPAVRERIRSFVQPFDLSAPPLIRAHLYRFPDGGQLFLLDTHHIISDDVSANLFFGELIRLYNGAAPEAPSLQYKDFAVWQQNNLTGEAFIEQQRYWLEQFATPPPALNLQTDFPRPSLLSFSGKTIHFLLPDDRTRYLEEWAQRLECTVNVLLLANLYVLLYKYTGKEDLVIGTPVAGRTKAEIIDMPGVFVNTLALRSHPSGNLTFREFLREVKETSMAALRYQDYPFETLVSQLDWKRDRSHHPLFDILFSFLHEERSRLVIGDAILDPVKEINDTSKFDLSLHGIRKEKGIELALEYNTGLFHETTIHRFMGHFVYLVEQTMHHLDKSLAAISILSPAEEKALLMEGDNTRIKYPADKCLHQLFEQQAAKFPARTALVWNDQEISYGELNQKTGQLAATIQRMAGEIHNPIIAVLLDRGPEMVIALLGILKAGGAYLPIDPAYPPDRIRYMLEDSRPALLIVSSDKDQPGFSVKQLAMDDLPTDTVHSATHVQPNDLAYIIYTSGSTGNPKGVMIEHRNVVRLFYNDNKPFDFTEDDTWTLFHSYCFDFSVWEMYGALLFGGKLVIVPKEVAQNPPVFLRLLRQQQVTILNQTPGSFYNIIDEETSHPSPVLPWPSLSAPSSPASSLPSSPASSLPSAQGLSLRYVIFGGEALNPKKLAPWKERFPDCRLINMYGITETTVHVTYKEITSAEISTGTSNIGKPIPTLSLLILGPDGKLMPRGLAGELCIGGAGLARGYLNRPQLTATRFIDHPYTPGEKLYRSGDLAKLKDNGDVEYLGRIDQQVKIRGYRIEPGEIESRLLLHPDITHVFVTAIEREEEKGTKYLCAYIVGNNALPLTDLRKYLLDSLPDYMVPSWFVQMESFPLTGNGKIDKQRLPLPESTDTPAAVYEAPVTPTEKELAVLWHDLLHITRAGRKDDFFDRGGHSLKAAQLVGLIHQRFKVALLIRDIFATPCLHDLASLIDGTAHTGFHRIAQAPVSPWYPASSAAKRLFILNQIGETGISYNIPGVYAIEGNFNPVQFSQAIDTIVKRHDILRSAFIVRDKEVVQVVQDPIEFVTGRQTCEDGALAETIRDFIRPFALSRAPLLRTSLVESTSGRWYFLFDIHHIIADDISVENFIQELSMAYGGRQLSPLSIQYKDFSVWQKKWLSSEEAFAQKAFWVGQFQERPPLVNLPSDFTRPLVKSYKGDVFRFSIPPQTSVRLKEIGQLQGATPFMMLLAAYTILLSKYSGQQDMIIGTAVAGRSHPDLQNLIGMFVNTLPLRTFPDKETRFIDYLLQVKDTCLAAFEHQLYPLEELLDNLDIRRDVGRNPLFDYMLSYREDDKQFIRISDLVLEQIPVSHPASKMDMSMDITETEKGGLSIVIEYATKLFLPQTIERFAGHFRQILEQITLNPQARLKDIEWVTLNEKQQLETEFNAPVTAEEEEDAGTKEGRHIFDVFEEKARLYPGNIAVDDGRSRLTYNELYEKACRLSGILKENGCGPDTLVGLYTLRSVDMIVGIFAILRAGGAFLPLDPDYPLERIRYMLEDSAAILVLTQRQLAGNLPFVKTKILLDDTGISSALSSVTSYPLSLSVPLSAVSSSGHSTPAGPSPADLAYVIYTSGSTGNPKGVEIEHRSLFNFLQGYTQAFTNGISPTDRCAAISAASFDASVLEIFLPLTAGATLVIISRENVYDVQGLANLLTHEKITFCFIPPSLLPSLYTALKKKEPLFLNKLNTGAESVKDATLEKYALLKKDMEIINAYGPTEATIVSSFYKYKPGAAGEGDAPIGKPLHHVHIYILDECQKLQPVGVPGEVYIAGKGLARGYRNHPALTGQAFIDNPFRPGEKMYKTGDLAKWQPDGNIVFVGRKDQQVKIRGQRIELGEIENQLMTHPDVRQVLVIDKTDRAGNKFLCAYIIATKELPQPLLRAHLARQLPEFMIPSFFIPLEKFPLTNSGKIDRHSLPEPVPKNQQPDAGGELPADLTETKVLSIWKSVLGAENIGVTDNFFEIGGNSMKVINLMEVFRETTGDALKVTDLFDKPTIRQQAAILSQVSRPAVSSSKKVKRTEF